MSDRSLSPPPLFAVVRVAALGALAMGILAACDQGPSTRVLESRLENLEDKLKVIEKRAETAMLTAESGGQDLKQRVESVEQKSSEAIAQTSSFAEEANSRFQRIEQSISNVMRIKEESEAVAYLEPEAPGHRTLQTEHGTFLVRIESIERDLVGGGYRAELNIGNPMGLELQEFRLKGDFGLPAPKLNPGEAYGDYSKRLDEWQKTMTPFDEGLVGSIQPNAWTRVSLPLRAASNPEQLKLIRVAMVVSRAQLANQEGPGDFSVINADSDGAGLVKTDYGPLLMTVADMTPEGAGTRVRVRVGNPFGFVINEAILTGQFGPSPPRKMETEANELYRKRLELWSEQMLPLEAKFTGTIAPLRWSEATFLVPTADQSRIKYLRLKMQVTNITLPNTSPIP
jgi:hypothetical protein